MTCHRGGLIDHQQRGIAEQYFNFYFRIGRERGQRGYLGYLDGVVSAD